MVGLMLLLSFFIFSTTLKADSGPRPQLRGGTTFFLEGVEVKFQRDPFRGFGVRSILTHF